MSEKKSKKKGKGAEKPAEAGREGVRLSAHPRAMASIRRVRGWCGLIGFGLVTILSLRSGLLLPDAVLRGLAGGAVALLRRLVRRHQAVAPGRPGRARRRARTP